MTASTPSETSKQIAVLAHLLGIFTMFVGPLVIWLTKRESDEYVEAQSKEALNFQITVALAYAANSMIGSVLSFVWWVPGTLVSLGIFIVVVWWSIKAIAAANEGQQARYAFALRLVR